MKNLKQPAWGRLVLPVLLLALGLPGVGPTDCLWQGMALAQSDQGAVAPGASGESPTQAPAALPAAPQQGGAQAAPDTSPANPQQDAGQVAPDKPQTGPLKGGVQKVELSLDKLRDVDVDVKHLLRAASSLYDEVTMQPVSIETEPEIIGLGTIVPIPIATMPAGPPLPARKDRVDLAMSHIRPVVEQFKTNVDAFLSGERELDLPDDTRQDLEPYFRDWVAVVNDANKQLQILNSLTQGPPYDQPAIASAAAAIHDDGQRLRKNLKKVYNIVRKEGKRIKAREKTAAKS